MYAARRSLYTFRRRRVRRNSLLCVSRIILALARAQSTRDCQPASMQQSSVAPKRTTATLRLDVDVDAVVAALTSIEQTSGLHTQESKSNLTCKLPGTHNFAHTTTTSNRRLVRTQYAIFDCCCRRLRRRLSATAKALECALAQTEYLIKCRRRWRWAVCAWCGAIQDDVRNTRAHTGAAVSRCACRSRGACETFVPCANAVANFISNCFGI